MKNSQKITLIGKRQRRIIALLITIVVMNSGCDTKMALEYAWCMLRGWITTPDVEVVVVPYINIDENNARNDATRFYIGTVKPTISQTFDALQEMSESRDNLQWKHGFTDKQVRDGDVLMRMLHEYLVLATGHELSRNQISNYLANNKSNVILGIEITETPIALLVNFKLYNSDTNLAGVAPTVVVTQAERNTNTLKTKISKAAELALRSVVRPSKQQSCFDQFIN
jgi:hypothetical protein